MSDYLITNWKAKYSIGPFTFNDKWGFVIKNTEGDRSKHKEISMDKMGYSLFKEMVLDIMKRPPESKRIMTIRVQDRETKSWSVDSLIGLEKNSEGIYSIFVDTKINGEMRQYVATITAGQKYGMTTGDASDKEKSDMAMSAFREYIMGIPTELLLGERDKKMYFLTKTNENIAGKVGAEVAKPKAFGGGGGNKSYGGGGGSYKKPASMSKKVDENEYLPPESIDADDIMNF